MCYGTRRFVGGLAVFDVSNECGGFVTEVQAVQAEPVAKMTRRHIREDRMHSSTAV
jgi:hypothetical protein